MAKYLSLKDGERYDNKYLGRFYETKKKLLCVIINKNQGKQAEPTLTQGE